MPRVPNDARTVDYHSPYGFGPAIDGLLDVVADRRDLSPDELSEIIHRNNDQVYDWIDLEFWDRFVGPAVDALEDRAFPNDPS